ncbi:MAG: purine-nucleoside phosphorylase [Clostridia bacterium]|nr:purine-nucleoside phosphorylase [Clostridia bacterium]
MLKTPTIAMYETSADYLREKLHTVGLPAPTTAVILGSGLGTYAEAETIQNKIHIPYRDIPEFPVSTVSYQKGELVAGEVAGKTVLFFNGRFHYYEGWEMWETAYPVSVCHLLGVKTMLITNAAGGLRPETLTPGDLICVTDHIKLCADSPVRGKNLPEMGERFFDMQSVYDRSLIAMAKACANENGFSLGEGVYAYMTGPQFETPAEIRMLRLLGADLVGMSTVPEVICAAHCGIRVLCISCVTNYAAGVTGAPMTEKEVLDTSASIAGKFRTLLDAVIPKL